MEIALIGTGYWGSKLKLYLEENPHFNLKYLCDSKTDLNKVWMDDTVEAVVIATRNDSHYDLTKRALQAGKHVLVEKPLALNTGQAEEIRMDARNRGLKVVTEYVFTFSKALALAQNMVADGVIGKLLGADFSAKHLGRFGGGSVYWLLGSHWMSVLDMFIPLETLTFSNHDLVTYDGDIESGVINFNGDGFAGQISVSLNYPGKDVQVVLYGEKGTITYNPSAAPSLKVVCYDRLRWTVADKIPRDVVEFNIDESHNLRNTVEYFWDVLCGVKDDNLDRSVKVTQRLNQLTKTTHHKLKK